MKTKHAVKGLTIALITSAIPFLTGCDKAPTREELVAKYPSIEQGSTRPENIKVLCPFVRMLERSSILDGESIAEDALVIEGDVLTAAAKELGCGTLECGTVVNSIVKSQDIGGVDIERLHQAGAISHDCGLTFAKGGTEVDDAVRQATLDRFAELADEDGHLVFADIETVKAEICAAQGVEQSGAGALESKLIFAYLAGVDRGYIEYSDLEHFLHAEMPSIKTKSYIDALLISRIR